MIQEKSLFDIVRENIRLLVIYMHDELNVPTDMIKVQLDAIVHLLIIQERMKNESHPQ